MNHRKLRIASSVAWGVAAVLVCVLCVRSHTWRDRLDLPLTSKCWFGLDSVQGWAYLWVATSDHGASLYVNTDPVARYSFRYDEKAYFGIRVDVSESRWLVAVPERCLSLRHLLQFLSA